MQATNKAQKKGSIHRETPSLYKYNYNKTRDKINSSETRI